MTVNNLPLVDRIQGLTYHESTSSDPSAGLVEVQYTDRGHKRHALKMPVSDALHLLRILEQMVKDEGLESLRDPV